VIRPRSATLTLVLALVSACSKGSAPGPARGAADAVKMEAREQREEAPVAPTSEVAAEPTAANPPPPPGPESEAKRAESAPGGGGPAADVEALTGSRLQLAEPMINGGLDRDIIRRKAQDHDDELRACYERDPKLAGTVAVKLSVDARGKVKDVELGADSELEDREVVDCMLELLAGWSFAGEASSAATVELRFELKPSE
jgi:hypothetical protein